MFSTAADEFMLAFALQSVDGDIIDVDEQYLRFMASTWEYRGDKVNATYYPLHPCTEEDQGKFA